jgi:hypothetical protein
MMLAIQLAPGVTRYIQIDEDRPIPPAVKLDRDLLGYLAEAHTIKQICEHLGICNATAVFKVNRLVERCQAVRTSGKRPYFYRKC